MKSVATTSGRNFEGCLSSDKCMRVDRPTDWQIKNNALLLVSRSTNLVIVTTRCHQLKELKMGPVLPRQHCKAHDIGNAEYQGWREVQISYGMRPPRRLHRHK